MAVQCVLSISTPVRLDHIRVGASALGLAIVLRDGAVT